jgi:hypothetical protein
VLAVKRTRKYPSRPLANRFFRINEKGKRKEIITADPGGAGCEIVREMLVCPACAARQTRS